jgi:hypothetical protein
MLDHNYDSFPLVEESTENYSNQLPNVEKPTVQTKLQEAIQELKYCYYCGLEVIAPCVRGSEFKKCTNEPLPYNPPQL